MADSTTAALLMNRRRRAMIACKACRKRKIKCVTTEEPPRNPCARCTKRSLTCEYVAVDEDYSSTPTPESPILPLPYSNGSAHNAPPTAYMPTYPVQPPYGQWNPPPPSQPSHPGYPPNYNASPPYMPSQAPYGGSQAQGYSAPYGYPSQYAAPVEPVVARVYATTEMQLSWPRMLLRRTVSRGRLPSLLAPHYCTFSHSFPSYLIVRACGHS
ncbi:hypothetical protein C8R46DRAFT_632103 [Mycena filopes]|nr:hypothetical protein C8R46DRAFT_632103 [Mycena filopes]